MGVSRRQRRTPRPRQRGALAASSRTVLRGFARPCVARIGGSVLRRALAGRRGVGKEARQPISCHLVKRDLVTAAPIETDAGVASGGMREGFLESVCGGGTTSSWPPPNLARVNSPVTTSIAAACVERAWTSSPAQVKVPCPAWSNPPPLGVRRSPISGQTNPRTSERVQPTPSSDRNQGHSV
jgi:hypothetical protein